jgi:Thioester domain
VLVSALAAAGVTVAAAPAFAHRVPPPVGGAFSAPPTAQIQIGPIGHDVGSAVTGFLGPASFDPLAGYPPTTFDPVAHGFTPVDGGAILFAGTFAGTTDTGDIVHFYCVDLLTDTTDGIGYNASTWSMANVPNIGLIHRILDLYYPQTNQPASLATNALRAAAVQAAIWFFSNKMVLEQTGAGANIYPAVSAIVSAVLAAGPDNNEPQLPTLTVNGPGTLTVDAVTGPYTVAGGSGERTVSVTNATIFADAAGHTPLPSPATLPAGTPFFLRPDGAGPVTISATATGTLRFGSVAVYAPADPANPDPVNAQTLILASGGTVIIRVSRTVTAQVPQPTATGSVTESVAPLPVTGSAAPGGFALAGAGMVFVATVLLLMARRRAHLE